MLRKFIVIIYLLLILIMAMATVLEKYNGTAFSLRYVYGVWWFGALWALLVAVAAVWIVRRRMHRWPALLLHGSLVVILAGALLTHLTAHEGMLHLRTHADATDIFYESQPDGTTRECRLPFRVYLDAFRVNYHAGTDAAADYESHLLLRDADGRREQRATVRMNQVVRFKQYRLMQHSYDADARGAILRVSTDPWGTPVTYFGYALLFVSLIAMLIDPRMQFRTLLRSPLLRQGLTLLALCLLPFTGASAAEKQAPLPPVMPEAQAEHMGKLLVLHNGRICPMETMAAEITRKLTGRRSYRSLTPMQLLSGLIFWGEQWNAEPFIRLKGGALRNYRHLPARVSINHFFDSSGYNIGPQVQEYYAGQQDAFHQQCVDMDARIQLVLRQGQGSSLRILPVAAQDGSIRWISPVDPLPADVHLSEDQAQLVEHVLDLLGEHVLQSDWAAVDTLVDGLLRYQQRYGGDTVPSALQLKAEFAYNRVPFATILFMLNLTLGFLSLALRIRRLVDSSRSARVQRPMLPLSRVQLACLSFSLVALSLALAMRWIIGGTVPLSNGYETMLTVAWLVQLIVVVAGLRLEASANSGLRSLVPLLATFGFLLTGFFLLVSHIGSMDPAIGRIMPVLNSPLLSVHVSIIMMSYALLSLTFITSLMALLLVLIRRLRLRAAAAGQPAGQRLVWLRQQRQLQLLSRIFLLPAITTLGIGIFTGAVWAHVSRGNYWSWDPKETWALSTLMNYAAAIHQQSIPRLRRPLFFHIYMVLAFLSLIITYFGVNYFLGGMHSYA
jgi:cytochrome c-type biogenesis protein CcsB